MRTRTMPRARVLLPILLGVLSALAGCASPNPVLFTLAAAPGAPQTIAARSLELRRIGIAGYLDRPEIVRAETGFQLQLAHNERWAEPTGSMIERVFTEDLVQRLPGTSVFSESGAISTQPDLVLEVDIQRMDADGSGQVVLLAQLAVRHETGGQPAHAETIRLTAAPAGPATQDLVATESALLGQLADRVAARLGA